MTQTIIDKLERADGPDRELDGLIEIAVNGDRQTILGEEPGRFPQKAIWGPQRDLCLTGQELADYISAPSYTASIDAAMTLGRDDWERADMMLTAMGALGSPDYMKSGTWLKILPIHLCIAALRARSQRGE